MLIELATGALIGAATFAGTERLALLLIQQSADRLEQEDANDRAQQREAAAAEVADAILDLIEAKLTDRPLEWTGAQGTLTHGPSGLSITDMGNTLVVARGATRFAVTGERRDSLLSACQLRNVHEVKDALTERPKTAGSIAALLALPGKAP